MWLMQVKVFDRDKHERGWKSVRCTGASEPYKYDTREEAEKALRDCYPDQCLLGGDGSVRVIEESELEKENAHGH